MARDRDIMEVADAAAFLGVHVETLRKLARRRDIPAFKIGRDWRFRREALVRWADQQPREAAPCPVLVVDDDERMCRTLVSVVGRFGCRARYATSGAEGLRLLHEELPELVLLDLQMPRMNGAQFLSKLRETQPTLPVVIVTAHPEGALMEQAMQHAPILLLPKPVEPELLRRTMRALIGDRVSE